MRKYIRIGVDIAKNWLSSPRAGERRLFATKRRLSRSGIVKLLAEVHDRHGGLRLGAFGRGVARWATR